MVEALADKVNADYISIDDGSLGCNGNHRKVWTWLAETTADWSVVLEDDASPADDFTTQLERALAIAPTPIVSLYLGRERPPHWQPFIQMSLKEAQATNCCWLTSDELLHAVGVAIRTELITPMLEQTNTLIAFDEAVGLWARANQHRIAYTLPSLINHEDGPTLFKHPDGDRRYPGRVAWWTGTRDQWTSKSLPLRQPSLAR